MTSAEAEAQNEERAPVNLRCAVLLFRQDSVLVCENTLRPGEYVLPGGTPRRGENAAAAASREVFEETGLRVSVGRVPFVLEANSWQGYHLIEIVFLGEEIDLSLEPVQREEHLAPYFVPLAELDKVTLRPPIGGYIKGFPRQRSAQMDWQLGTGSWLGNLWRAQGS